MDSVNKAIKEDVRAAIEAFRKDSFDDMNLLANRIMANAVFGTDSKIFLCGFFLKDVAFIFGVLKTRKEAAAYSTAKAHGFKYVESLGKSLSSLDEKELWNEFHSFNDAIRKFGLSDFEEKSYSDNIEFSKNSFSWLLEHLKKNREILFDSNNFLLRGTANEMERIFRVHSGELSEIVLISLVKALDRYYEYFRRIHEKQYRCVNEESVRKFIFPYIDRMEKVYSQELEIGHADEILWELVKGWREFYIQYMELPTPKITFEKGIELPNEIKKKLEKSITESLEKEM